MLQRTANPVYRKNGFLATKQFINHKLNSSKLALVYALLPVGVLSSFSHTLHTPQLFGGQNVPYAMVLPITGGEPEAKDTASITAGTAPVAFQLPLHGFNITTYFSYWHPGVDMAIEQGTPIKPVAKGVVTEATYNYFGYGNTVVVDHGDGTWTRYAHLLHMFVKVGDTVTPDMVIGQVGNTGHSTGPHLHFELHEGDQAIDPLTVLPKDDQASGVADSSVLPK